MVIVIGGVSNGQTTWNRRFAAFSDTRTDQMLIRSLPRETIVPSPATQSAWISGQSDWQCLRADTNVLRGLGSFGRRAGPIRNAEIVKLRRIDRILGWPKQRTLNTIVQAHRLACL